MKPLPFEGFFEVPSLDEQRRILADHVTVPSLAEQQAMEDEEPCFGRCDGCGRRDAPLFRSLTGYRCEVCLHEPVIGTRLP